MVNQQGHKQNAQNQVGDGWPLRLPVLAAAPEEESEQKEGQCGAQPLVDGHSRNADIVFHPEEPAGDCSEWGDCGGDEKRPPAGMSERLIAARSGDEIRHHRNGNQSRGEIHQDGMELGDRDKIMQGVKSAKKVKGLSGEHVGELSFRMRVAGRRAHYS